MAYVSRSKSIRLRFIGKARDEIDRRLIVSKIVRRHQRGGDPDKCGECSAPLDPTFRGVPSGSAGRDQCGCVDYQRGRTGRDFTVVV